MLLRGELVHECLGRGAVSDPRRVHHAPDDAREARRDGGAYVKVGTGQVYGDESAARGSVELGYYVVMIRINIHEAKTHLSRYLPALERGETIILCKRNVPIAEIRPLPAERREPRPVGLMRGAFSVPETFFDPLPEETLRAFEGREGG